MTSCNYLRPHRRTFMMEDTVVEGEEWKVRAEEEKAEGNRLFKEGKLGECIEAYSRAIALDVDNHVLYSNRSAAYLKKGDSKSKALKDAEKCVSLMPEWTKGFNRMGAAQQALGRYDAAIKTFEKGLALGDIGAKPDAALTAALKGCREAQVAWQQQKDEAAARAKLLLMPAGVRVRASRGTGMERWKAMTWVRFSHAKC